ncbi:hypothetical protein TGARI_371000 [Toxoplasma gondii ARI]|uniref:Transmembrane protein n=1 Tax=Toxoplasma gondii ARI TaxID=1074872 RepID=A0A139XRJ5_TOXGO|nr:hypothetical protein TGARI_371000 [Toxoplasma gondii ARI]
MNPWNACSNIPPFWHPRGSWACAALLAGTGKLHSGVLGSGLSAKERFLLFVGFHFVGSPAFSSVLFGRALFDSELRAIRCKPVDLLAAWNAQEKLMGSPVSQGATHPQWD